MAQDALARLGQWCFRRRWPVLGIWLAAVIAGVVSVGPVFSGLVTGTGPSSLESVQGANLLDSVSDQGASVTGLVTSVAPAAPAVRDQVLAAAADLRAIAGVHSVQTPYDPGLAPAVAAAGFAVDGHGLAIQVVLANDGAVATRTTVDAISTRLAALGPALVAAGQPGARVLVGGGAVLNGQANDLVRQDLGRAEVVSLPITLVVLVLIFGGLVAAGLPVLAAVVSIVAVMTALLGFSHVIDLDSNSVTVVTLLGLGLSVDYGLLLVARYREELARGHRPVDAVARTWATAGRTIAFSALTVAAALTGLLAFGITGLSALGAAGLSIAVVAMLASLTFTAALLGVGHRFIRPSRRARAAAVQGTDTGAPAESGFFAGVAHLVQRRPAMVLVLCTAGLLAAGLPVTRAVIHLPGLDSLPADLPAVAVAKQLSTQYHQATTPAITVIARTDPATLDSWAQRWGTAAGVSRTAAAQQVAPGLSTLSIDMDGDQQGGPVRALVGRIRADRPPGGQSWVTGSAAILDDLLGLIVSRLPVALGLTLLGMVLLLFAMTGSVVVPVKAVLMNVVSLGATFGVMVAVFEHGVLARPLGLLTVAGIDPFVLVIVFAFAFALSMDYEVFLLSRIKEYVDAGAHTDQAVRAGLQRSGRIITSAALLMVIVFGCFGLAHDGQIQQIGLGLAVAVAVDATVVRCLLVPAAMTLLGRWNWWAPGWLRRVSRRVGLREYVGPGPATDPAITADPGEAAQLDHLPT